MFFFKRPRRRKHEVCVVGSGFAGTAIALSLAARGVDIVVVEAGSDFSQNLPEGQANLFPSNVAEEYSFPVDFNRSISLGGTSNKWNGVVSRLLPSDLRSHSEFGLFSDWPLSYRELEHYYPQAEQFLHYVPDAHSNGRWPVFRAGLDLRLVREGFSMRAGGAPVRLCDVEIPRLAAQPSVTLLTKQVAQQIRCAKTQATELRILSWDGTETVIEAERFVIAAGVVESVRLLLNSRSSRNPDGLGNRYDQLGRYLHTHPRPRIHLETSDRDPDMGGLFRSVQYCDSNRRRGWGAVCVDINLFEPGLTIDITIETEPSAQNRILLAQPLGGRAGEAVRIVGGETDCDRRTWQFVHALQRDLADRLAPGAAIRVADLSVFHPAGGCRMAADERSGVVDANGRVFGTDNLFVSGAAVFPTSGALNPTLTVIALALRLADHLAAAR